MNKAQKMVLEYHRKMGFTINNNPTHISQEQVKDRSDILEEETHELREALELEDIVKIADGIGDVLYVAYGTGVACGIDMETIFAEIHRSNMTKTAPETHTGKAIKGETYSPPNLVALIPSNTDKEK